jgi:hypothetical protein
MEANVSTPRKKEGFVERLNEVAGDHDTAIGPAEQVGATTEERRFAQLNRIPAASNAAWKTDA